MRTRLRGYRSKLRSEGKFSESEALQYGEIDCNAFFDLLMDLEMNLSDNQRATFVDIGSGSGKAVLIAAATEKFIKATGIEIVEDLHNMALAQKKSGKIETIRT